MRLFIAIDLDEPARAACRRAAQEIAARLHEFAPACGVKWVAPENLHITLRFIGHVSDAAAARMAQVMEPPLPIAAFEARLGGVVAFPERGAPRVIWIALAEGQDALATVHAEVERRLDPFKLPTEDRAFTAHLTLARFRTPASGAGARIRQALCAIAVADVRWSVNRVTLYESRLSPKGAVYRPVTFALLSGFGKQG